MVLGARNTESWNVRQSRFLSTCSEPVVTSTKYDFVRVAWWDQAERPCHVGSSTVTTFDAHLSITSMLLGGTVVILAKGF